jgi:hypothetical protein
MSRKIHIIFCIVCLAIISLPFLQTERPWFPEPRLNGVVVESRWPTWSWANWWSGNFQSQVDAWLSDHLGLRSYFIKSDNQLNFSLFQEISQKTSTPIVLGKDRQLYEQAYIDDYVATSTVEFSRLESRVWELKQLQDLLLARGKKFIVLISPSKAAIYPEYLPLGVNIKLRPPLTSYDLYRGLLDKYQVNYFDSRAYLLSLKQAGSLALFAKGGIHWSYFSACLVSAKIWHNFNNSSKDWPEIACNNLKLQDFPRKEDSDLRDLINIWQEKIFYELLIYPHPYLSNNTTYRPRLLIVGGSFIWNFLRIVKEAKIIGDSDFYYYFSEHYRYPADTFLPLAKDSWNFKQVLTDRDAVILESNESSLTNVGFGFVTEAISQLQRP